MDDIKEIKLEDIKSSDKNNSQSSETNEMNDYNNTENDFQEDSESKIEKQDDEMNNMGYVSKASISDMNKTSDDEGYNNTKSSYSVKTSKSNLSDSNKKLSGNSIVNTNNTSSMKSRKVSMADNSEPNKSKFYDNSNIQSNAEEWLLMRVGITPKNSLGWFRCGVGFYNKKEYTRSIECFERSIQLDPLNYNAYQIMARACIAVNRKEDAIAALKQSVMLDNPSDWQLLVELTSINDD